MENFFEQMATNERLLSGLSSKCMNAFSLITPSNFEQRCLEIKSKMAEWLTKVIKEVRKKNSNVNSTSIIFDQSQNKVSQIESTVISQDLSTYRQPEPQINFRRSE